MFAQLIEARVAPGRREILERLVHSELMPALRQEPGFCGALSLVDGEQARTFVVLLWETEEEAARPLVPDASAFRQATSTLAELLGAESCITTIWEVNARA